MPAIRLRSLRPPLAGCLAAVTIFAGCDLNSGEEAPATGPRTATQLRGCDLYASPAGGDGGERRGSRRQPFRTVKRLLSTLPAGRTGCLLEGTYTHGGVARMRNPHTTLRAAPGARVTVRGTIWILGGATGARLSGIRLTTDDPVYSIPLKVQADDVTVSGNVITGTRSTICMLVGSERVARNILIEGNRIRFCGRAGEHHHLIYLQQTRGAVIRWNLLTANRGGWAIHFYPDSDGSIAEHNVMDSNKGGVVFAGVDGDTSDENSVRRNAITFSAPRFNVESSWSGGPQGRDNEVVRNCLFSIGPGRPAGVGFREGVELKDNMVLARSPYVARRRGDYRFLPRSRCLAAVGDVVGRRGFPSP